jgi:hypothetical protein
MAADLGATIVHRDRTSILGCDRQPLLWRSGIARGWGWGDQTVRRQGQARSWREAAVDFGCCGVVAPARGPRFIHSSVTGIGPVYWLQDGGAVYFASRIDPLVRAIGRTLSVDWEAWAGIFTTDQPIGDRTPFAEVRRLRPMSRLELVGGLARVVEETWPWAEIEEPASPGRVVSDAVAAMRDVVAELDPGRARSLLSGGRDSRLALALLRERADLQLSAFTLPDQSGHAGEDKTAQRVADELGVPLERVGAPRKNRWERFVDRAPLVDFQFARQSWLHALIPRLARERGPVADGLALDQFLPVWRSGAEDMMSRGRATARQLWRIYSRRAIRRLFPAPLAKAIVRSARDQYMAEAQRFDGHPQQIIVAAYRLRTVRGISTVPNATLGSQLDMFTPFTDHRVVSELMRIPARVKADGSAAAALMDAIHPALARIPRGADLPRDPSSGPPAAWSSTDFSRDIECVEQGPLAAALRPDWSRRALSSGVVSGVALFSLWHAHYADLLGDADAREAFGVRA